jgi:taurine dioxygenase
MLTSAASPALGRIVEDDPRALSERDWSELRVALFEKDHLLLFRGNPLDDDEHLAVVRHFGPVAPEGRGGAELVRWVSNVRPDGALGSIAATWHIDYGFFERPYEALSLYGSVIPETGAETWFCNAKAAAADLPGDLRQRVEGLQARQVADVTCSVGEAGVRVRLGRLDESYPHFVRPVLWPHHVTRDPILGVWEQQTDALLPLPDDESNELIEALFAHLYRPEHLYVHHWELHDLVVWDNHAIQHSRPDVGHDHPRTLRRVSIGQPQDLTIFASRRPWLAERQGPGRLKG